MKLHRFTLFFTVLAFLMIPAHSVFAQAASWGQDQPHIRLNQMDADHDGAVSKDEFNDATTKKAFQMADSNHDGKLSYTEWNRFDTSPESKKHFDTIDADKSGDVSLVEFQNGKVHFLDLANLLSGKGPSKQMEEAQTENPQNVFKILDNDNNNLLTDEEVPSNTGFKIVSFKF